MKGQEALAALEQDIKDRVILAEDRQLKLCTIIEKELKALEIIKEKNVDTFYLVTCPILDCYNSETWNKLTQEEFDLLKEALGD